MNTMMLLEMAASGFGDRRAVQNEDDALSYQELFDAAGTAAERVKASGAAHLAMLDVSTPALPVALFASGWAGVPFVPLNYRLTGEELDELFERITPALLVVSPEREGELSGRPGIEVISRDDFLAQARGFDTPPEPDTWGMDPEDIAILLFTSGTTGPPKAAVLRHKHLVSYILTTVEYGAADEAQATLMSVPPYHIAAMAALASSIYSGRRIVQLANFDAERWVDLARSEQITNAFVVPTMLSRIVESLGDAAPGEGPPVGAIAYGGGKMPQAVIERAMALFPDTSFTNAYGLTETSSTISLLGPDDHRSAMASDDPAVRRRLVSVGQPLPTVEVQIRDDEGNAVGPNERGEIFVRGEQVSGEYLGRGSLVDEEGWFPTRDGGSLDSEGYLFLEGRVDDIIVRGGENMSPGEIEDVLLEHPAIGDAAVVGVPDEQWGEAVAARVVHVGHEPLPKVSDLQQWVKDRLRSSRVPERIEFVDELPYNETGKLLRRKVRADLIASSG